jgi:hypothetical protein
VTNANIPVDDKTEVRVQNEYAMFSIGKLESEGSRIEKVQQAGTLGPLSMFSVSISARLACAALSGLAAAEPSEYMYPLSVEAGEIEFRF